VLGEHKLVRFHNASIRDFLHLRLNENPDDYLDLVDSAPFFDQVVLLGNYGGLELTRRGFRTRERDFPDLALALTAKAAKLTAAFRRTFHSAECGITTLRAGGVRLARDSEPLSAEERARLALLALSALRLDPPDWLLDAIADLGSRWTTGGADKQEAIALIRELNRSSAPESAHPDEERLKTWFLSTLDAPADFKALKDLQRAKPDVLPEKDLDPVAHEVESVIEAEFWHAVDSATSAGELERVYEELDKLAAQFGRDLPELVDLDAYDEKVKELGEIEDWHEEQSRDEFRDERSARRAEEAEIAALFDTLGDRE
jgi:hypothetical protein